MTAHETITIAAHGSGSEPTEPVEVPRRLGVVRLIREVARGGMGVVYLGYHELLDRDVAVKFLLRACADQMDPHFEEFLAGARAAAAVQHHGLVAIHDAATAGDVPYLVQQFVDGPTLRDVLAANGRLEPTVAVPAAIAIAEAVAALHEREIVHRDIKPTNVLVDAAGKVLVTDFGLTVLQKATAKGGAPKLAGTPSYMAPEMFEGESSVRTDVYALGVMLFEMLTGNLPFTGTVTAVRDAHRGSPLPTDALREAGVAENIIEIIERATNKEAIYRYKTARHMTLALRETAVGKGYESGAAVLASAVAARHREAPTPHTTGDSSDPSSYFDTLSRHADKRRTERDALTPTDPTPSAPAELSNEPEASEPQSVPHATGPHIALDVPCAGCGYNLRGLTGEGRCPECHYAVPRSLDPDRLLFADPRWLAAVTRGLWMISLSMVCWLLFPFVALVPLMLTRAPAGGTAPRGLMLIGLGVILLLVGAILTLTLVGVFGATYERFDRKRNHRLLAQRTTIRRSAVLGVGLLVVSRLLGNDEGPGMVAAIVGFICLVVATMGFLARFQLLAAQIPDLRLLKQVRHAAILLSTALVSLPIIAAIGDNAKSVARIVQAGLMVIVLLATPIYVWAVIHGLHKALGRQRRQVVDRERIFAEEPQ